MALRCSLIHGAEVEWYVEDQNRYEMTTARMDAVLDQIKLITAKKPEKATTLGVESPAEREPLSWK